MRLAWVAIVPGVLLVAVVVWGALQSSSDPAIEPSRAARDDVAQRARLPRSDSIEAAPPLPGPGLAVVDELGLPVRGARVSIQRVDISSRRQELEFGGAARLDLPLSETGHYEVSAIAPGRVTALERFWWHQDDPPPAMDLRLDTGHTLVVQVRCVDGTPASHRVMVLGDEGSHPPILRRGMTDADGVVTFELVPRGEFRLHGAGATFSDKGPEELVVSVPQTCRVTVMDEGRETSEGDVLHPVRVLSAEGVPLRGLQVRALRFGHELDVVWTDADGRAGLELQGTLGYDRIEIDTGAGWTETFPLTPASHGVPVEVDEFRLSDRVHVEGTVRGPDGAVEGARVVATAARRIARRLAPSGSEEARGPLPFGAEGEWTTESGADGSFRLGPLPRSAAPMIHASAPGLVLRRGIEVGTVQDASWIQDPTGRPRVAGELMLRVRPLEPHELGDRVLRLVEDPRVVARSSLRTVEGTVVDSEGAPRPGAVICLGFYPLRQDEPSSPVIAHNCVWFRFTVASRSGRFTANVPPGMGLAAWANTRRYGRDRRIVTSELPGSEPLVLEAPLPARLACEVRDQHGRVATGLRAWDYGYGAELGMDSGADPQVSPDGRVAFPNAAAWAMLGFDGEFYLDDDGGSFVDAPGFRRREVLLSELDDRRIVVLEPARFVTGRVVDPAGRPVVHATIELPRGSPRRVLASTDADGRFRAELPVDGALQLRITHEDGRSGMVRVYSEATDVRVILRD